MTRIGSTLLCLGILGCQQDEETVWVQFNATDDQLEVEITAAEDLGEAVSTELSSTSSTVVVGSASVDPGSGPVGTDHLVEVDVDFEWEDIIDRVSVRTDSGERGVDEYDLKRDSADHGHWWIELTSVGEEGEERVDVLTFRLWEQVAVEEAGTSTTTTTTTRTMGMSSAGWQRRVASD